MIEEHAVILSVDTHAPDQPSATLEIVRKTACGLCGQTRGCGNSLWGKLFGHQSPNFTAQNSINAKVGDSVIVGIDERALMKSALLLYMVPLASMFIVAMLSGWLFNSHLSEMLGALAGLCLGFVWVKGHSAGRAYYLSNQPKILRLDGAPFKENSVNFQ